MSHYSDLYTKELEENSERWKKALKDNQADLGKFKDLFLDKIELEFDKNDFDDFNVVAADAGRNSIEFKNKLRVMVARAAAVDNEGNTSRSLLADIITVYSQGSFEDLRDNASESLEIDCIKDLLAKQDSSKQTFVLIDGSLLTRSLVLPSELNLSDHQDYKLNLIENIHGLFEEARKNENLTVLGVSKDSNTDIFFSSVLLEELERELSSENIENRDEIIDKVRRYRNHPKEIENLRKDLEKDLGSESRVFDLLDVLEDSRYDTGLIENLTSDSCITVPVESGMISQKLKSRLEYFQSNKDSFVENYFAKTLEEGSRSEEDVKQAINKIYELPSIATFYWTPENGAQPLRIDIPSFHLEEDNNTMSSLEGTRVLEINDNIYDVLSVLEKGYGGESMHNIWISEADNIAGLPNRELENVFLPLMSQKLEINLHEYLRRRDKRV